MANITNFKLVGESKAVSRVRVSMDNGNTWGILYNASNEPTTEKIECEFCGVLYDQDKICPNYYNQNAVYIDAIENSRTFRDEEGYWGIDATVYAYNDHDQCFDSFPKNYEGYGDRIEINEYGQTTYIYY